jgi:M6 family metalloprotease-like protein
MIRHPLCTLVAVALAGLTPIFALAQAEKIDLSEYRTVDNAVTTRISKAAPAAAGQAAYLGIHVGSDGGKLVVGDVDAGSPAARAGIQRGDIVVQLAGQPVSHPDGLRETIMARSPGESVKLALLRNNQAIDVTVTLGSVSRPMRLGTQRAVLGIRVGDPKEGDGVAVTQVVAGSPAEKAGLEVGDIILKIDGVSLTDPAKLSDAIAEKKPGDTVELTLKWNKKTVDLKVPLAGEPAIAGPALAWDNRIPSYWRKDVYRLAVVAVEYPDAKHNPKITAAEWEESLFSKASYVKKNNATGQPVFGSLNDYYQEQSHNKLRVEGKFFDWVQVSKNRNDYSQGTGTGNKTALLTEALDKLHARDGKDCLKDYDGIFFLYAGGRVQTTRGGLYWPHRASFTHQGKRWGYFIVPEGGTRMTNISVICHEFGHMLGLPDLYARPENPGSEGVGTWCAMSNQIGNGRPQHFSAWCKEQLGWIQPAVIDPTVKQKLILAPVEDSSRECVKVLVRLDGSEYLLLENRRKKGFDQDLPAEGLLIWRVVGNRPILEESHGVEGPAGPRVFPNAVPFPSQANSAFTPYTTPSSRSQLGGGLPVHITSIRRLPDGRITFHVGYEYQ